MIEASCPDEAGPFPPAADLSHALSTDPEGAFVARDKEGRVLGRASAAVRDETLLLLALDVLEGHRGHGAGRALVDAARAYGAARGARVLEVLAPDEPSALAFFLRAGLLVRSLVLDLQAVLPETRGERRAASGANPGRASLAPVGLGVPLSGWVAALDRETRGFARPREWGRLVNEGHAFALRRGGRPVAIGGWRVGAHGETALGPIAAKTPEAAADLLPLLAALPPGRRMTLALPSDARLLLVSAKALGFRTAATRVLLADIRQGDFRRYAGGGGHFF